MMTSISPLQSQSQAQASAMQSLTMQGVSDSEEQMAFGVRMNQRIQMATTEATTQNAAAAMAVSMTSANASLAKECGKQVSDSFKSQ